MQQTKLKGLTSQEFDELAINTIRTLSSDAVQQAKSGHPGTPMALAPLKELQRKFGFEPERVGSVAMSYSAAADAALMSRANGRGVAADKEKHVDAR